MKSIEDHIEYDKKIADDPQANPAARRLSLIHISEPTRP